MVRRNPFIYTMALAAAVLATMMPLANGTTSSSAGICTDQQEACLADGECNACVNDADEDCDLTTEPSDLDAACNMLHDGFCCALGSKDCQENELMIEHIDCFFLTIGCTEAFDCTEYRATSANGATGIVNSAVVSGCLAMAPFVSIMTTVFATG